MDATQILKEKNVYHQQKCRFCLKCTNSTRKFSPITENIKNDFVSLTNFEVKLRTSQLSDDSHSFDCLFQLSLSDNYSKRVCSQCLVLLEDSLKFQGRIIDLQKKLYDFEDATTVWIETIKPEIKEDSKAESIVKKEIFVFEELYSDIHANSFLPDTESYPEMQKENRTMKVVLERINLQDHQKLIRRKKQNKKSQHKQELVQCEYCPKIMTRQYILAHVSRRTF